MNIKLSENTTIEVDIKWIVGLVIGTLTIASSAIGIYNSVLTGIDAAKILPAPEVSRVEYDLKFKNQGDVILRLEEDMKELKQEIKELQR